MGFKKVFSDNLADAIGVTSSQVRKDFSIFDLSGHKKGGYLIEDLIHKINKILGKEEVEKVIIVGCGNIGTALMRYNGFEKEFIKVVAAFDNNSAKTNCDSQVPILPIEEMHDFIVKEKIRTAILAVPDQAAQHVVDILVNAGIKGVLNFSPLYLRVPEDFIISNVNLEVELEGVIYFVNAMQGSSEKESMENNDE
jgi:redox-sensing transcriptional repressor